MFLWGHDTFFDENFDFKFFWWKVQKEKHFILKANLFRTFKQSILLTFKIVAYHGFQNNMKQQKLES